MEPPWSGIECETQRHPLTKAPKRSLRRHLTGLWSSRGTFARTDPIERHERKRQAWQRLRAQKRRAGQLHGRVVAISLMGLPCSGPRSSYKWPPATIQSSAASPRRWPRRQNDRDHGDADEGERVNPVVDRVAVALEDREAADAGEVGVEPPDQVDHVHRDQHPATAPVTTLVRSEKPTAIAPKPAKSDAGRRACSALDLDYDHCPMLPGPSARIPIMRPTELPGRKPCRFSSSPRSR